MKAVLDVSAGTAVALQQDGFEAVEWAIGKCERILAPDLYRSEAANTIWKHIVLRGLDKERAMECFGKLLSLVDSYIPSSGLIDEAFFEAVNQNHPVYDMLYLTLARQHNAALISLDKKLTLLAGKLGLTIYYDPEWMNK